MSDIIARSGHSSNLKRDFILSSTTGAELVPAQGAGQKIRVTSMSVVATTAVSFSLASAATAICSAKPLGANGGLVLPHNPLGWYETAANEALNIVLGAAVVVAVDITYVVVS